MNYETVPRDLKDTTEAEFIKYLNDKTFVFNNLIVTGLLFVWL